MTKNNFPIYSITFSSSTLIAITKLDSTSAWINLQTFVCVVCSFCVHRFPQHGNWERAKALWEFVFNQQPMKNHLSNFRGRSKNFNLCSDVTKRQKRVDMRHKFSTTGVKKNLRQLNKSRVLHSNPSFFGSSLIHHSQSFSLFNIPQMLTKREEACCSILFEIWLPKHTPLVISLWKFHSYCWFKVERIYVKPKGKHFCGSVWFYVLTGKSMNVSLLLISTQSVAGKVNGDCSTLLMKL